MFFDGLDKLFVLPVRALKSILYERRLNKGRVDFEYGLTLAGLQIGCKMLNRASLHP
jgi:hypothetical protein